MLPREQWGVFSFFMNHSLFEKHEALGKWYPPVMLDPGTIFARARRPETREKVIEVLSTLTPDEYSVFLSAYVSDGLAKFKADWQYLDIVNVLYAAAELVRPATYLEVGVRRGRSMSMVAATVPQAKLFGFDMWVSNYAGMDNPGAQFVASELRKIGHVGQVEFLAGNSHETLPAFFRQHPSQMFDIITVDGDHSDKGAYRDLRDVLPHLARGGVLVFDDINHPDHPNLYAVWKKALRDSKLPLAEAAYFDLGYGVALAIRK
jgi:predicted O-methyltransferase YrrM